MKITWSTIRKEDVKEHTSFMSSCKLVKPQKMRFLK